MAASRKSKVFSLSLAQGVLTLSGVVSSMVFTRLLSKEDYATYLQTFLAYDFVTPLLTLGIPSALYYFLPNEPRGKKVVTEVMLLLLLMGSVYSLFMLCGGTSLLAKRFSNPALTETLPWLNAYPLYTFPVACLSAILVVNDKVLLNSRYNVLTGLALTLLTIVATVIGHNYAYPLAVKIAFPLLMFPLALYFAFRYTAGAFEVPEASNMWKILKFSVPLGMASIFASLALQLSNVIVSSFCPPGDYAIYAVGAREIPLISAITGSVAVVIMADMAKQIKDGKREEALQLFNKGTTATSMLLMPIMVFLFVFGDSFIHILFSQSYSNSIIPFRIYLLYLPIRIAQYNSVYIAFGQSRAVLFRTTLHMLLTVLFCVCFVWLFGYWGAALGAILASYLWAVPYNIVKLSESFQCKKREVLPFSKIGNSLMFSVICGMISLPCLFISSSPLVTFCLGGLVYFTAYYLLMSRFNPEFKQLTYPIIHKFKRK